MSLLDAIKEPAEGFKGVLGVAVKHLDTGEEASHNGEKLFPTASVFKVPVLVEFYRQVERGLLSLDEEVVLMESDKAPGSGVLKELSEGISISLRDLLSLMMIVSDNTATDLIASRVGFDNVNRMLDELGLSRTRVVKYCREILFDLVGVNNLPLKKMTLDVFKAAAEGGDYVGSWSLGVEGNDVTTPMEMTRLLELIAGGEATSRESCDNILELMGKCQTGGYRIPKYLPSKAVLLQRKTGSLPGIRNDVGVVTMKETGERYALSCFTMGAEDVYEAEEAIAQVSLNVYNHFAR
ncbi:serine hydrolase [Candidatus Bathyarchaeota archaeon]|nr:serine hydrolase [Candidatus Bathyarchaeota archaeon]